MSVRIRGPSDRPKVNVCSIRSDLLARHPQGTPANRKNAPLGAFRSNSRRTSMYKRLFSALVAAMFVFSFLSAVHAAPRASAQDASSTCVDETGYGCDPSTSSASDAGDYNCQADESDN